MAASCRTHAGKRHSHQRRIKATALDALRRGLAPNHVRAVASFAELHAVVERIRRSIVGIGAVTVYDVALRVGCYLQHEPDVVYLHAGTSKGARALGLGSGRGTLEMSALPDELQFLRPAEVEDFLCIYKDRLAAAGRARPAEAAPSPT